MLATLLSGSRLAEGTGRAQLPLLLGSRYAFEIDVSGIGSAEAFGGLTRTGANTERTLTTLTPVAIGTSETFGVLTRRGGSKDVLQVIGIASLEQIGILSRVGGERAGETPGAQFGSDVYQSDGPAAVWDCLISDIDLWTVDITDEPRFLVAVSDSMGGA